MTPIPVGPIVGESLPLTLGQVVITSNALSKLRIEDALFALSRHMRGDWGDLDAEDHEANDRALSEGRILFSVYHSPNKVKFYIVTEGNPTVSTIMLPEDY